MGFPLAVSELGRHRELHRAEAESMVKSKGKGGKNRRRGKNDSESKRELTFKEDGQGGLL